MFATLQDIAGPRHCLASSSEFLSRAVMAPDAIKRRFFQFLVVYPLMQCYSCAEAGSLSSMSSPYVGQIIMFGGNFPPSGWMFCSGQILPISENDVLFNLIGTTYGGDGQSTFALPNLQSRIPIHQGQGSGLSNYVIGQASGTEAVTLTTNQIPQHTHVPLANSNPGTNSVASSATILSTENSTAQGGGNAFTYVPAGNPQAQMSNASIALTGGNLSHENVQPILAINYCISLFGIYPSPN